MGLFDEIGEKAKDAGKFISDSAKDALFLLLFILLNL